MALDTFTIDFGLGIGFVCLYWLGLDNFSVGRGRELGPGFLKRWSLDQLDVVSTVE